VVAGGVTVPGCACAGVLAFGGRVVEAEGLGDDGGGCLEDELAEGGDPCGTHRESEVAQLGEDGGVGGWLAWVAAGDQPVAGGGGAVGDELEEQAGEGFGDGGGRVAEMDVHLAVVAAGDVAGGQADEAAEWLGVQEHEAGDGADSGGCVVVGDVAVQQGEAAVLGDRFAGAEAELRELAGGDVAGGDGPVQEAARALGLVDGRGGVPGVDVGLGEVCGLAAEGGGPGEKVLGLDEALAGVSGGAGP